jgi:hypothetical protein
LKQETIFIARDDEAGGGFDHNFTSVPVIMDGNWKLFGNRGRDTSGGGGG